MIGNNRVARHPGLCPFVLFVALLLLGPVLASDPASGAIAETNTRCASPPSGISISAQEKDRFVGLWEPRVTDTSSFQKYVDLETVPEAIIAEGFHHVDALTKGWLVACLVEDIIDTVGFDGQPPGVAPTRQRVLENEATLALLIFEKQALNEFRADAHGTTPVADPDPSTAQVAVATETKNLANTRIPLPPAAGKSLPVLPAAKAVQARSEVGPSVLFPPADALARLVGAALKNALEAPASLLARPPLHLISGVTYRVCREGLSAPLACTIPIPVGVPVPIGLDGDLIPDVSAQLALKPDLSRPADGIVAFTVLRLPTAPSGPLPYRVFAVYDPPLTTTRIELGFDGRPSTLAAKADATITVKRLFLGGSGNDLDVQLVLTHEKPGTAEAVTLAVKKLASQGFGKPFREIDPLAGVVQFSPVPKSLTTRVQLRNADGKEQTTLSLNSSAPTLVEAQMTRDVTSGAATARREIRTRIEQLPTSATVDLTRQGDRTTLHFFASAEIAQLSVGDKRTPDLARPGSFTESVYKVQRVPADVNVAIAGSGELHYTASSKVDAASATLATYAGGPNPTSILSVALRSVPRAVDLVLKPAVSTVDWTAADVTGGLDLVAQFSPPVAPAGRTLQASLTLSGIPRRWTASHAADHPVFHGISGPIDLVQAAFTNHGTATMLDGDHLSAVFDQASGDADVSLRTKKLFLADYEALTGPPSGFRAKLQMGDGSPFAVNAKVTRGGSSGASKGTISPLPASMAFEGADGKLRYQGSANTTINLAAEYGTAGGLAATAEPPATHGLAVRDGSSCRDGVCGNAVKSRLFLTGFPKELDFDTHAGVYRVKGFAPESPLVVDVALGSVVPKPVSALLTQEGIPSGADFTFGPSGSTTLTDGTTTSHLGYTASAALGKLTATVALGGNETYFQASSVPASVAVDTSFGPVTKTAAVALGSPIAQIKVMSRRVGEPSFSSGLQLGDVPATLSLTIGRQDGGQGVALPKFSSRASAPGLDITLFAQARIFGAGPATALDLAVTDLGQDVTAGLNGREWKVVSTPATGSFNLLGSGHLSEHDRPSGGGFISVDHTLDLEVEFTELNIVFHNLSSLIMTPKAAFGIQGQYGDFGLGAKSFGTLDVTLGVYLNLGIGKIEILPLAHKGAQGEFVGNFRLATNHKGFWKRIPTGIPCVDGFKIKNLFVRLDLMPHPHATTSEGSFLISPPGSGEGDAWIVTLNPFSLLSDTELDLVAFFDGPFGDNLDVETTCGRD